jgi:hypothetical protein
MEMKTPISQSHKLLIQVEDKSKPRIVRNGIEYKAIMWKEVDKLNLGSLVKPSPISKEIMAIRLEPIRYN